MNRSISRLLKERWGLLLLTLSLASALTYLALTAVAALPGEVVRAVQALPIDPWTKLLAVIAIALIAWIGTRLVSWGRKIHEQLQSPVSNRSLRQDLDDLVGFRADVQELIRRYEARDAAQEKRINAVEDYAHGLESVVIERFEAVTKVIEELAGKVALTLRIAEIDKRLSDLSEQLATVQAYLHKRDPEFTPRRGSASGQPTLPEEVP